MKAALSIKGLKKSFRKGLYAVNGLDLEIQEGEIFALLGPNGAGKSTTINMTTGLTRIQEGSIQVFGYDVVKDFEVTRRLTGVMNQEVVLDNFFPIEQALKIHSGYFGLKDDPAWREELIARLQLGPHLKKKPIMLSGGMKRRFMVAKALIHKPKLLILDEPTAGVDVELRRSLWGFVREMNKKGTTVVLTTHYLEEAESMCNRVAIMNHGKLVALDETQNLMKHFSEKNLEDVFVKLTSTAENGAAKT